MRNSMIQLATDRLKDALETARRMGADGTRLSFRQKERIGCEFENGRIKSAETHQNISFHVEVLLGGRRAGASGNDLGEVDDVISRAVALAKVGGTAHFDAYPPPGDVHAVKTHSPRTAELPREIIIRACQTIADELKAFDPDMFISASGERSESESLIVTSGGVCHTSKDTAWSLGSYVQRTDGTDMLFAGYERYGIDLDKRWDPEWIVQRTLEDLRLGEKLTEPPVGKIKALFPPRTLRRLLGALELGVSGRSIAKGESPLQGRLGERILDESLTILDDPHSDFCPGAQEIDKCGIPTRVIPIVTKGVLENFLYDLDSGALAGAEPTGNDGCLPHSLTVLPGNTPYEGLLSEIDDGIIIKQMIGFGMSNLINGDFSCNVGLGFRVRDGKITGRVKDTMIAGNFYELLGSNLRVGADVDPVYRTPHAVVDGMSVGSG